MNSSPPVSKNLKCLLTGHLCSFFKKFWPCKARKQDGDLSTEKDFFKTVQENFMWERSKHFTALSAEDVCIPRTDIVAVPLDVSYEDLVSMFLKSTFSRLPVYQNTLDHIIGMVHIKDVLKASLDPRKFDLTPLLRDVLFISPAISLRNLLLEMQTSHIHLAIVVDEFGGVDGLITLENVIERLLGDIHDDPEVKNTPKILQTGEGTYLADARLSLEEFHETTGFPLVLPKREEDINTLGGYVIAMLGHMPSRGELVLSPSGLEFEVIDSDPRRLNRLRIRLPLSASSETPTAPPSSHD